MSGPNKWLEWTKQRQEARRARAPLPPPPDVLRRLPSLRGDVPAALPQVVQAAPRRAQQSERKPRAAGVRRHTDATKSRMSVARSELYLARATKQGLRAVGDVTGAGLRVRRLALNIGRPKAATLLGVVASTVWYLEKYDRLLVLARLRYDALLLDLEAKAAGAPAFERAQNCVYCGVPIDQIRPRNTRACSQACYQRHYWQGYKSRRRPWSRKPGQESAA